MGESVGLKTPPYDWAFWKSDQFVQWKLGSQGGQTTSKPKHVSFLFPLAQRTDSKLSYVGCLLVGPFAHLLALG